MGVEKGSGSGKWHWKWSLAGLVDCVWSGNGKLTIFTEQYARPQCKDMKNQTGALNEFRI